MAKRIKAVKCPQCGSNKHTVLRPDYYQCKNCGTEYFIDSDDITINHNHRYDQPLPVGATASWGKAGLLLLGMIAIVFLVLFLGIMGTSRSSGNRDTPSRPATKWYGSYSISWIFEDKQGQPVYFMLGKRGTEGGRNVDRDKLYAGFYDARTRKERKVTDLNLSMDNFSTSDSKCRLFSNGELYVIINEAKLYKVDRDHLLLLEVKPDTYNTIPQLRSGFAHIEFLYESYGDGFAITTNEGEKIDYYPLIQKVYRQGTNEAYEAREALNTLPANAPVRTGFAFSSKSSDAASAREVALVRYHYHDVPGYPSDSYYFSNEKMQSGKPFSPRMTDFKDFTPGRMYFYPKVLTGDDEVVLIAFRATAAESSPYSIQLLDAKTAAILWTYTPTVSSSSLYVYNGIKCRQGYFVNGNIYDLFIGNDGKHPVVLDHDSL